MRASLALVCVILGGCGLVLDLDSESTAIDGGSAADAGRGDGAREDGALDGGGPVADGNLLDAGSLDAGLPASVSRVLAGWRHTCVLDATGALWCWGRDDEGQVSGSPTTCTSVSGCQLTPLRVGDASALFRPPLGASEEHTCAIAIDGTRTCWGTNSTGELGVGDESTRPGLVRADAETTAWTLLSGGQDHMCGLSGDALSCWGDNGAGAIGDGTFDDRFLPTSVLGRWRSVDAGYDFTCAIADDGRLYCWGENDYGQLGPGAPGATSATPVAIDARTDWIDVSAGEDHACGLRDDGSIWCWGTNYARQLGASGFLGIASHDPVQIDGGPYRALRVGGDHACAFTEDGRLWCWGQNSDGELGIGTTDDGPPAVVPHPDGEAWAEAITGREHTCATDATGELWCWGSSEWGQLGLGDRTPRLVPTRVTY